MRKLVNDASRFALHPDRAADLDARFTERVAARLAALPSGPNRVALLLMQTRMSRSIALFGTSVLGSRVESVYPYLDHRIADFVFAHAPDVRVGRDLQDYALVRYYPEQRSIPNTHMKLNEIPPRYYTALGKWYARQNARVLASAARRALATPALEPWISKKARTMLHAAAWGASLPFLGTRICRRAWIVPRLARLAAALRAAQRWTRAAAATHASLPHDAHTS